MQRLLVGIVFLSFLLRVPLLDNFPLGFTPDEASFGYDAYSLLKTGKDQWGHPFPLVLESFGDFKPPLYAYLSIPTVAIFGLTRFATRLPNALLGTAAVFVTYLLVKELKLLGKQKLEIDHWPLEILAAIFMAISPWHIQLSRGAFEANLTTFFLPLGIFLFLKGLTKSKFLVLSAFILGLNLFSYHSARFVTPFIFLSLLVLFRKEALKVQRKNLYFSLVVFLFFGLLVILTFFQGAGRRVGDVSIFRGALEAQADDRLKALENGVNPIVARIFYNKYRVVGERFVNNYKQYFSINFLFKDGPAEATYGMVPGIGVLYWFELPLLVGFLFFLMKERGNMFLRLIFFWILASPIPAGLSTGVGFAGNRAAVAMPSLQIASAIGLLFYYQKLKRIWDKRTLNLFFIGVILTICAFVLSFLKEYFGGKNTLAKGMLYGNLEAGYWLAQNSYGRSKIVVSRHLSEPHIYIAFANSWSPQNYQEYTEDWSRYKKESLTFLDQLGSYRLGKYSFQTIEGKDIYGSLNSFWVGKPEDFPDTIDVVAKFNYPDGSSAILIAKPYGQAYVFNSF